MNIKKFGLIHHLYSTHIFSIKVDALFYKYIISRNADPHKYWFSMHQLLHANPVGKEVVLFGNIVLKLRVRCRPVTVVDDRATRQPPYPLAVRIRADDGVVTARQDGHIHTSVTPIGVHHTYGRVHPGYTCENFPRPVQILPATAHHK